jgi:acyl-CoA thioester hydrolase
MTKFAITYRGVVYPWQCDHMGHMNVMWYVGKFDEACWQLLSMVGASGARMREAQTGMAAVDQHIEYKRELHPGDVITIRSTILEVRDRSLRMRHEMTNDETAELVASMDVVGVHLDFAARKALPLAPELRERASKLINSSPADYPRTDREVSAPPPL